MIAATAVALIACGGGGGGSPAPAQSPPGSGLVPTAPAPGGVIAFEAAGYRPFIDSASWTYRGTRLEGPTTIPLNYDNVVTHSGTSGVSVVESGTNIDYGGSYLQTMSYRNGEVHASSAVEFVPGQPTTLDQLELRSPLRASDQYVIIDAGNIALGLDADGDGVSESFDLGVWSRVMGEEIIDLPNAPQVHAVRVTTTLATRVRYSATGQVSATETGTLENWYAYGVGIVKHASDLPGDAVGQRVRLEEVLVNWDGVDQGLGHLESRLAASPGGAVLANVSEGLTFITHALVMGAAGATGTALSQIDMRGTVLSSTLHASINPSRAHLFRLAADARVVALADDNSGMYLYPIDIAGNSTGAPVLLRPGVIEPTGGSVPFVGASTATTLWLVWMESPTTQFPSYRLTARAFDVNGQPLGAAITLAETIHPVFIGNLNASSSGNYALVAWNETAGGLTTSRYAVLEGPQASGPFIRTLRDPDTQALLHRAATASNPALLWRGAPSGTSTAGIYGVTLDRDGVPMRSTSGDIQFEPVPLPWLTGADDLRIGSSEPYLDLATYSMTKLWPQDALDSQVTIVSEVSTGPAPFATWNQTRLLARGTWPATSVVVGGDFSVLLLANTINGVMVTPVWRRTLH